MLVTVLTIGQPKRIFNSNSVTELLCQKNTVELIPHIYLLIANSNGLPQKVWLGVLVKGVKPING